MSKKQHKLDVELRDLVRDGVLKGKNVSITLVIHLLQNGANPSATTAQDELTAYNIIRQNNQSGKYNFIEELFDEHSNPHEHLRVSDSVGEGMIANPKYDR
ncbi:MAG: hypothetical protein ACHP9Y_05200 [Gammaproteobacteria bacterium]